MNVTLFDYLSNNSKNVLYCNNRIFYPQGVLIPKLSIVSIRDKNYKNEVLKSIEKLKTNNKIINKNIKIIYNIKTFNNSELLKLETSSLKYLKYSKLKINYNLDVNNFNFNQIININNKKFIKSTIILTTPEKMYYWKKL